MKGHDATYTMVLVFVSVESGGADEPVEAGDVREDVSEAAPEEPEPLVPASAVDAGEDGGGDCAPVSEPDVGGGAAEEGGGEDGGGGGGEAGDVGGEGEDGGGTLFIFPHSFPFCLIQYYHSVCDFITSYNLFVSLEGKFMMYFLCLC